MHALPNLFSLLKARFFFGSLLWWCNSQIMDGELRRMQKRRTTHSLCRVFISFHEFGFLLFFFCFCRLTSTIKLLGKNCFSALLSSTYPQLRHCFLLILLSSHYWYHHLIDKTTFFYLKKKISKFRIFWLTVKKRKKRKFAKKTQKVVADNS